jgi:hypothetical protein
VNTCRHASILGDMGFWRLYRQPQPVAYLRLAVAPPE